MVQKMYYSLFHSFVLVLIDYKNILSVPLTLFMRPLIIDFLKFYCSCGDGTLGIPSQRGDNYECRNMKLLLKQQQRVIAFYCLVIDACI